MRVPLSAHSEPGPRIAEKLLRHVESRSALRGGDENPLPADVTQTIFQALNLSTEKKLRILPLLQNPDGILIATMRDYISKHFKVFEMIASALGSWKQKLALPLPRLKPADITANTAALDEDKEPKDRKKLRDGKPKKNGRLGGKPGSHLSGWAGGKEKDGEGGWKKSCKYCVAKKKPPDSHILPRCPWVSAANRGDLLQTLPQMCVGCLHIKKPTEVHTCPPQFKEGGAPSHYFCAPCKCNAKLCQSPGTHTAGHIPVTFVGAAVRMDAEENEEIAVWALDSINKGALGS